jgi:hypothetical protein
MRRMMALIATVGLVASLAASSVAAAPVVPRNSFVGDFEFVEEGTGAVVGYVTAQLSLPTTQRLVPGHYDFYGVPGNWIRESHAQIGRVEFWFDPAHPGPDLGGSNVAFAEGVECLYLNPGDSICHEFAVMFIDDLNRALPDQVAFANRDPDTGEWAFDWWYHVGKGSFVLSYSGG